MEINTNINPWAVGAVVLDQRPYLQFFQQQMAQRQAKETALDNYFRDLGKNVTPAGMRAQDVDGLTKKTNEWRQFYSQNKDAISNPRVDNGKAYTEYMARYQDQLAHIEQSKRALKTTDELNKTRLSPNSSYILDDPGIIDKIQLHDKPIGDPTRQDIDIATLAVPPKPWDIKDREAYSKYLTAGLPFDETPGKTETLPGFKTRTPIIKQYSPESLQAIGQRAMGAYDSDRSLQFQTNSLVKEVMNDEGLHNQLNNAFKQVYGKDAETPKELLAAQAILTENRKATKVEEGEDKLGMQLFMEKIKHANAKDLAAYKKQIDPNDTELNNVWYQRHLDNIIEGSKEGERRHMFKGNKSLGYYRVIKPDAFTAKAFARDIGEPDRIGVSESGEIVPIFYKYDQKTKELETTSTGAPVINELYSKPMSYEQALINLGYRGTTKKQLGKDLQNIRPSQTTNVAHPLPTGRPRTVKQGGHTYTWNDQTGNYE